MKMASAILVAISVVGCSEQVPLQHRGDRAAFDQLRADMPTVIFKVETLEHQVAELKKQISELTSQVTLTIPERQRIRFFLEMLQARELEANWRKMHPEDPAWSDEIKLAIRQNRVTVGMTAEQVFNAWGEPSDRQFLTTEGGQTMTARFEKREHWSATPPVGKWIVTLKSTGQGSKPAFVVTSIATE